MSKETQGQITEESSTRFIISIFIVITSLVLFYVNPLAFSTILYKVLVLLVGLVIAGFVFFKSPQGIQLNAFAKETKIELRKVVWPMKDEVIKTTSMIIVAVIIVSIFLWIVDAFFTWSIQLLIN